MQDEVKVSKAARDAATQLMPVNTLAECEYVAAVKAGKHGGDYRVQAFAKFEQSIRHQAERDTLARMEWRDSTAEAPPRDGTRILVRNDRGTFTVEWDEDCIDGWWVCPDGKHDDRPLRGGEPTYWMPLPPAPEAGQ